MTTQSLLVSLLSLVLVSSASAALILNPARPIVEEVRVQPIVVSNDGGGNTAPFLGTPTEQAIIEGFIDQIWAQAGIDVNFLPAGSYNSTFALQGNTGSNNPRPTNDLNSIVNAAALAGGVLHPDPTVINLFFVRIVPFFSQQPNNTANGYAFVGSNGISQWVGPTLPTFGAGQELAAAVIAHEIGHNLGLPHLMPEETENLMLSTGAALPFGERLNAAQIQAALSSNLSLPIPEPSSSLLGIVGFLVLLRRQR